MRIIPPVAESSEQNIVQAMSQVSLKYLQLIGLKNKNKNLENLELQREQERKTWEAKSQSWEPKCQKLQTKNDKLMKQVIGQETVQGENHLIWDAIIIEADNFIPYLDYILDKEVVIHSSRKIMAVAREKLNKKPVDYANNSINFLNGFSEDDLKNANIKDRISIMTLLYQNPVTIM